MVFELALGDRDAQLGRGDLVIDLLELAIGEPLLKLPVFPAPIEARLRRGHRRIIGGDLREE
jgi:hypothetical protein